MLDEKAIVFKVQYLHGKNGCKCGRHKREGECALPGEVSCHAPVLPSSRGGGMGGQKSAEAVVGG